MNLQKIAKRIAKMYSPGYFAVVYPDSGRVRAVFHRQGDAEKDCPQTAKVYRHVCVRGVHNLVPVSPPPKIWEYKGVVVFPAGLNSSGIRWSANAHVGMTLRADTKQGMRELITEAKKGA